MNFSTDKFLRGLRLVLALSPSRISLGYVVVDAIENKIIPDLRKEIARTDDAGKKEELERQLEVWRKYGDPRTSEGRSWNEEAAKIVASVAKKFSRRDDVAEELASDITSNFYTNERLRSLWGRFDVRSGPKGLLKLFKKVVADEAITLMRKKIKEWNRSESIDEEPEDGHSKSETIGDRRTTELDRKFIREVRKDMNRKVLRSLKAPETKLLYEIWMDVAADKGPENVNLRRDVYPEWSDETGLSESAMTTTHWRHIKNAIAEYFKNELGLNVGRRDKGVFAASEKVADAFIRQRLARWMLEPMISRRSWLS